MDGGGSRSWLQSLNLCLTKVLEFAAVSVVATLVLDVVWGVLTRYAWGEQAQWSEELARFLLIWVSMLGGALAFRRNEHLGIDFLVTKLDYDVRKGTVLFTQGMVCFVATSVFLYGGSRLVLDAFVLEQTTPALGWMMGYVYLAVPIAGLFMVLFSIENMLTMWSTSAEALFRNGNPSADIVQPGLNDPANQYADINVAPKGDR